MNRGIARRTVFEDRRDVRYFLSRLARAVRAQWIEVHAYCILTTHFHLLVRSPEASLSLAMCRVVNDYVRWFNRGRKRDGALFRGRFRSRPVDSLQYRRILVRYIDANPVLAGMVPAPALYPHGSACWYARDRRPIWLQRSWIEAEVRGVRAGARYDPLLYPARFGEPVSPALARIIERRTDSGARSPDPLDDLLGSAPERVLEWMRERALMADGTRVDLPLCDPVDVIEIIVRARALRPRWLLGLSRVSSDAWPLVEVGLLRELCGSSWADIGARIGLSDQGALRHHRLHARAMAVSRDYTEVIGCLASAAIANCYGPRQPACNPPTQHLAADLVSGSVLRLAANRP